MKKRADDDWVDVHDDSLMVSLGLRQPALTPRDPSVWTKSSKDKNVLKRLRKVVKNDFASGWGYTPAPIPLDGKLVITIKKNNKHMIYDEKLKRKVFKTTFSFDCNQRHIPFILAKFSEKKDKITKSYVIKYSWNGRTYSPTELPSWTW